MKKILFCVIALACAFTLSNAKSDEKSAETSPNANQVEFTAQGPVSLEGPIYLATPANTKDGFINLRQFPNAQSRSLRYLYEHYDRFYVRKVKGSKFYAYLYSNSYSSGIYGYVNGYYIQLIRRVN